ncbi:MAG: hypothetical protein ABSG51_18335, partial [Terracidiphilus sp.]
MMIHNTAILLCGLVLLPAAWGQAPKLAGQKAAPPQTGISKKPGNDGMQPDVRSLKDLLSKTGRVEYSSRFLPGSNNAPRQQWQQITDVSIDAPGCLVRVLLDESYGGGAPKSEAKTYFFETFDEVEALTEQEASDREDKRLGLAPAWTISGSVYDLVINGNRSDLRFADGAQASRAAETLRRLARPCHRPLDTRPEGGAPKLAETLQYIVDKLNAQG